MTRTEAPSYPNSIFIAGRLWRADQVCRQYCDETGFCVTTTRTLYIYTNGQEPGVIVGLINYPRFPNTPEQLWERAETLAERLRVALEQES